MNYLLDHDALTPVALEQVRRIREQPHLVIVSFAELPAVAGILGISEKIVGECLRSNASKFESHDGFDLIILNIPDGVDNTDQPQKVCLYLARNLLLLVCDQNPTILGILAEIDAGDIKAVSLGRIIHLFFDRLTFDDSLVLDKIEQEIADLEVELINTPKNNPVFLASFRKKLMTLKLYYEQLLEIYEAIEQNENGLVEQKDMRYFRILAGRANRLYHGVLNLRDYVTQVREAYQTQIDINLNSVMKVFTVITSVFFPLTLIVGWYGMNLRMPEFSWRFGYLFVIALSLVTAAATLIYLKKKKWF
jgi:magnesium transporter